MKRHQGITEHGGRLGVNPRIQITYFDGQLSKGVGRIN